MDRSPDRRGRLSYRDLLLDTELVGFQSIEQGWNILLKQCDVEIGDNAMVNIGMELVENKY